METEKMGMPMEGSVPSVEQFVVIEGEVKNPLGWRPPTKRVYFILDTHSRTILQVIYFSQKAAQQRCNAENAKPTLAEKLKLTE